MTVQVAKRGDDQDLKLYRAYKLVIENGHALTDDQLCQMHYEAWHHAYVRSNGVDKAIITEDV